MNMGTRDTLITTREKAITKIKELVNSPEYLEKLPKDRLGEILKVLFPNPALYSFHVCETQEDMEELLDFGWREMNDNI